MKVDHLGFDNKGEKPSYKKGSIVTIIILFIASHLFFELGYFMGSHRIAAENEAVRSDLTNHLVGLVTLLGLLLAFTFSMASERFQERKRLVVDESSSIAEVFLSIDLFQSSRDIEMRKLLLEYLDLRIAYYNINLDRIEIENIARKTIQIRSLIWQLIVTEIKDYPNASLDSIISNYNDMIKVAEKRDYSTDDRVPKPIIWLLFSITVLTMMAIGFGSGTVFFRSIGYVIWLNICICSTLFIIINLDRPRDGIIIVSQSNLIDLKNNLRLP